MAIFERMVTAWRRRWWQPQLAAMQAAEGLRPVVVVTGASEGIGLALARRFAKARCDVLLVARRLDPLELAAAGIRADFKVDAQVLPLDVTAPDAIETIEAALARSGAYADVLVNSAGMGIAGPFVEQDAKVIDQLVELNVRALTSLTRHFLAGMRARGRGGVLNVASLGGYAPGPYQAAYYASKAYVISLSEALAAETAGEGVRVSALAPGPVDTAFHRRMRGESAYYLRVLPVSTPESVARFGYMGFSLGWRLIVPGLISPVLALATRVVPHRITIPILAWLLKPRGTQGPSTGT